MGVLDHDLRGAGGDGPLTGGGHLPGHLQPGGGGAGGLGLGIAFLPVGGEGGALDVCADQYFHWLVLSFPEGASVVTRTAGDGIRCSAMVSVMRWVRS